MGFVKKFFKTFSPIAMLLGMDKDEPKQQPQAQQGKSEAEQQNEAKEKQDDERRKRLLALQAGGKQPGQLTGPGGVQGQASTARKQLLGL